MTANEMIFGVYQDSVLQNPGIHLDDGIEEDGNWQRIWGKLICLLNQCYDVPSGRIRNRFIETLGVELDGIGYRLWDTERVIVFLTVIFQPVRLVSSERNIRDRITSRLDLWNRDAYNELVQDSYRTAEAFSGNIFGTQTQEQCYCNFSNVVLGSKFRESI